METLVADFMRAKERLDRNDTDTHIFGGVLGYCYSAAFIALVQTFLSAYLIVRGTTMFKNMGFPNEMQLMSST